MFTEQGKGSQVQPGVLAMIQDISARSDTPKLDPEFLGPYSPGACTRTHIPNQTPGNTGCARRAPGSFEVVRIFRYDT